MMEGKMESRWRLVAVLAVALSATFAVTGCDPAGCNHLYPRTDSGPCLPDGAK